MAVFPCYAQQALRNVKNLARVLFTFFFFLQEESALE